MRTITGLQEGKNKVLVTTSTIPATTMTARPETSLTHLQESDEQEEHIGVATELFEQELWQE